MHAEAGEWAQQVRGCGMHWNVDGDKGKLRKQWYLRYRGPNGSYGNVAEIEFHRGGFRMIEK